MQTGNGAAQSRAARQGEERFAPSKGDVVREAAAMRGDGLAASVRRIRGAEDALAARLPPGGLERAAVDGAAGRGVDDPERPVGMVGRQVDLVLASGPAAVAAARRLVLLLRAFNIVLPEWAAAAGVYARDGAAREAAVAAERGQFARRQTDRFRFTAMSVDLQLGRHRESQVKMLIQKRAILSPTHVVEYRAFRARLDTDPEEIDSPKAARDAEGCEVRLPGGAGVDSMGMRVMARKSKLDTMAAMHLRSLVALGVRVDINEGL